MGSTVMSTSISLSDVCTQVWHISLRRTREKSLQALVKKGSLEGAFICNIKLGGHSILDKKTGVKFGTFTHSSEGLPDCVHVSILGPAKTASLGGHQYSVSFIDNLSKHY